MLAQTHHLSESIIVKRVRVAVKIFEDGHRQKTFPEAVDGNFEGGSVGDFELTYIDRCQNGPRSRSCVGVRQV